MPSGWDTSADPSITSANGNHSAKHASRGPFDAAFTVLPDPAERTEPEPDQDFSWPDNSQPEARSADRGYAWLEQADTSLAAQPEAEPAPEPAATERIPRHQADGLTSPERTDFWAKPASEERTDFWAKSAPQERTDFWAKPTASASASADVQRPAPTPRAEEPAIAPASWPATVDTATTSAAEPAQRAATDVASGASAARPLSSAGSAAQATGSQRDGRRKDRYFPVRLLAVIVIAALIGSALVLLLK